MPDIRLSTGYCNDCGRKVLAVREAPKHAVWFLITLATAGLGVFVWLYLSMKDEVWRCANCGTEHQRKTRLA